MENQRKVVETNLGTNVDGKLLAWNSDVEKK
jgi:hypothetical protein